MTETNKMTLAQFQVDCESFFTTYPLNSEANIKEYVAGKSLEEIVEWIGDIGARYFDEKYAYIQKLILEIRGDYDIYEGDTDDDPLHFPENRKVVNSYQDVYNNVYQKHFMELPIIKNILEAVAKLRESKRIEEAKHIKVEDKEFTAIAMCDVLWSGWESDNTAWVVNDGGTNKLVTSNHGSLNFDQAKFLEEKIAEYEETIRQSRELLALLK